MDIVVVVAAAFTIEYTVVVYVRTNERMSYVCTFTGRYRDVVGCCVSCRHGIAKQHARAHTVCSPACDIMCVCVSADIVTGIGRMRIANAMRFDTTQSFIEYPLSVRTSHQRQSPLAATKSPFCPSRFFWFVMVFGALDALHFIPLRFWLCSFDHFAIVIQYCALVPCFARPLQIRHEARRANKCPAQTCIWCTFACWPPMDTRNPLNIWLGIFHYAQQLLQSVAVISANTWISTDFIHSYFLFCLFT